MKLLNLSTTKLRQSSCTDRIPQSVSDGDNPGHFMNVLKTPMKDRQPDDWQPKELTNKNMNKNGEITLNDQELIPQHPRKLVLKFVMLFDQLSI